MPSLRSLNIIVNLLPIDEILLWIIIKILKLCGKAGVDYGCAFVGHLGCLLLPSGLFQNSQSAANGVGTQRGLHRTSCLSVCRSGLSDPSSLCSLLLLYLRFLIFVNTEFQDRGWWHVFNFPFSIDPPWLLLCSLLRQTEGMEARATSGLKHKTTLPGSWMWNEEYLGLYSINTSFIIDHWKLIVLEGKR